MINVSFSNNAITIKRQKKTPPQRKDIKGEDGNTYNIVVPKSTKTIVEYTYTHKGPLKKNDMPDVLLKNFSEIECDLIYEKQKSAIQKTLTRNMQACVKQIDSILDYKEFLEGGIDAEALGNKCKELQIALKKK